MVTLRKESIQLTGPNGMEEFVLEEKDFGDMIVFDVFHAGKNLMTLGKDGAIIFMNFEVAQGQKHFLNVYFLTQFVEKMSR
jgi:hypothetical protein